MCSVLGRGPFEVRNRQRSTSERTSVEIVDGNSGRWRRLLRWREPRPMSRVNFLNRLELSTKYRARCWHLLRSRLRAWRTFSPQSFVGHRARLLRAFLQ